VIQTPPLRPCLIGTPVDATQLPLLHRAVCDTDTTLHDLIGTSVDATQLPLRLHLCAMCDTDSTLHDLIGSTSVDATQLPLRLHLCAVCDTETTLDGRIGTPLIAASWYAEIIDPSNISHSYHHLLK